MEFALNMYQTAALAIPVYYIGKVLQNRINFFKKYCIPAPVVGGILAAVLFLILRVSGIMSVKMDTTLQTAFMLAFFCSIGFGARIKVLRKGGIQLIFMVILVAVLCFIQDGLGAYLVSMFGIHPLMGTAIGSVPLVGGHGTAAAFGGLIEKLGVPAAETASYAAATYGLIAGCMIGGPLGHARIKQLGGGDATEEDKAAIDKSGSGNKTDLDQDKIMLAAALLLVSMGIGTIISAILGKLMTFSAAVGALLAGCIIRNICDAKNIKLPDHEIDVCGNITLYVFLSMAMMTMKLWELADLALPMIVTLLIQTFVMAVFAYYVVFYVMGRDYNAAVMLSGVCGFGLGATPNAIANMDAITSVYGPAPRAFLVIPIVGSMCADIVNSTIITLFMNIYG